MEREVEILGLGAVPMIDAGVPCSDSFAEDGERPLWGETCSTCCLYDGESLVAIPTHGTHFIALYSS
jgi:hypothetical protein